MTERDSLLQQAIKNQEKIHVGDLLGICSIKHSELPEEMWKYKGRWCFRAPTTRDEVGGHAIFQEMASKPTTITATNVNIMYGCLPGHKTTVADAVRAYVQSLLKSKHRTYVKIPRHLWPASWHKKGFKNPVCLLVRALYGHPEAGAHWEQHLRKIVVGLGGKAVESHPSTFWFENSKLMLTIYVDHLMVSGPAEAHGIGTS